MAYRFWGFSKFHFLSWLRSLAVKDLMPELRLGKVAENWCWSSISAQPWYAPVHLWQKNRLSDFLRPEEPGQRLWRSVRLSAAGSANEPAFWTELAAGSADCLIKTGSIRLYAGFLSNTIDSYFKRGRLRDNSLKFVMWTVGCRKPYAHVFFTKLVPNGFT